MSTAPTNPWHILGAQPGAPLEDVQRNYKALVAVWRSLRNDYQLAVLEGAWLLVSNPVCRAAYESALGPPATPAVGGRAYISSSAPANLIKHPAVRPAPTAAPQQQGVASTSSGPAHSQNTAASSDATIRPQPGTLQREELQRREPVRPTPRPAAVAPAQPAGEDRKDSVRQFISSSADKREKYTSDMTKAQKSLDTLHQEIFDVRFVYSFPPQKDGHHFYSHSNFAGLGRQAKSANEAEMLQRRVLEQTKEAEISKIKAAYKITHTDFETLNKQVYNAKLYLGDEGRAEEAKQEMIRAGESFRSWLLEFEDRDKARREAGDKLKRETAAANIARIEQDETDARAKIEFENRAARIIAGEDNHMSLDQVMASHPNGYGRDRILGRGGRAALDPKRLTAEEQAYEDRLGAVFNSRGGAQFVRGGYQGRGGRGRGGGGDRGGRGGYRGRPGWRWRDGK